MQQIMLIWCAFILCFQSYLLFKTVKAGQITIYVKGSRKVWKRFEKEHPAYMPLLALFGLCICVLGAFTLQLAFKEGITPF